MANNIAFQPMGKTVLLSCTTSSSNAVVTADSPVNQVYIVNTSGNAAFINVSSASNVGKSVNTSHIRSILLPYRKHQGKD